MCSTKWLFSSISDEELTRYMCEYITELSTLANFYGKQHMNSDWEQSEGEVSFALSMSGCCLGNQQFVSRSR